MKNTTEYQDLLRILAERGELSGTDRIRLERLLAEDPEIARLHERMERLDGLVRDDRTQLLKEAKTDQLRAAVSTLSRSVPAGTAAAGMLSVGKIISGGLLVLLLAVGAWVLLDRGEEGEVVVPVSSETSLSVPASAESFDNDAASVGDIEEAGTGPIREESAAGRLEEGGLSRGKESALRRADNPSEDLQSGLNGTEEVEKKEEKQSAPAHSVGPDGSIEVTGEFDLDHLKGGAKK